MTHHNRVESGIYKYNSDGTKEYKFLIGKEYFNPDVADQIQAEIDDIEDKLSRLSPASDPTTVVLREILTDQLAQKREIWEKVVELEIELI